jgi:hypothetical protein
MRLSQRLAGLPLQQKKLQPRVLEFGPWMPDLPALANPGMVIANGVIPGPADYHPMPGLSPQSNALVARCRGAFAAKTTAGVTYFYCGDETKLYSIRNQTVTDESGTDYSTTTDSVWRFVKFGNSILATNYDDPVQSIAIGGAGTFADHITSTEQPQARWMDVIRDFLVLGNINSTADGVVPNRVHWSAINDSADFDPAASTQCDFQDLPDGGHVQAIIGGASYGLVFQEMKIQRMTYVGSPLVFQFYPVDRSRGTNIPTSVIGHGGRVYFVNEEGFHVTDGSQTQNIGSNRVDTTFLRQFDPANAHRVSAAVDPANNLIVWSFPGTGSSAGLANKLYFYNYEQDKFSEADIETELVVLAETQGFTLEDLDNISTDIDAGVLLTFDSANYKGGQLRFAAFDTMHRLAYFTGDNLAATIETGESQLVGGRRSKVRKLRALVDNTNATLAIGSRTRQADAVTYTAEASMTSTGETSLLSDGRYQRFRLSIPAGEEWTHAQGIELVYSPTGMR